jgi:hypothetical protein
MRTSPDPKIETVTFRIDPALKAALAKIAEQESKPLGALMRELVREHIEQKKHQEFEAEASRQSESIAARARDRASDEAQVMRELETALGQDEFADEWKA